MEYRTGPIQSNFVNGLLSSTVLTFYVSNMHACTCPVDESQELRKATNQKAEVTEAQMSWTGDEGRMSPQHHLHCVSGLAVHVPSWTHYFVNIYSFQ